MTQEIQNTDTDIITQHLHSFVPGKEDEFPHTIHLLAGILNTKVLLKLQTVISDFIYYYKVLRDIIS